MEVKNICVGHKYTDKSGTEKTQWTTIGTMFIHSDGKMSMKLDMVPTNWDGGAMVFDRKPKDPTQVQQQQSDGVPF